MNLNSSQIIKKVEEFSEKIRLNGVEKLGLFGSYARDEADYESDIDFIVQFVSGQKSYKNLSDLYFLLEDLFGKRIEIVTPEGIKPLFFENIKNDIIYAKIN